MSNSRNIEQKSDSFSTFNVPRLNLEVPKSIHVGGTEPYQRNLTYISSPDPSPIGGSPISRTYSGAGSIATNEMMVNQKMNQLQNMFKNEVLLTDISPDENTFRMITTENDVAASE
jgi:hypothetical protein